MAVAADASRAPTLVQVLCLVVLATIALSVGYAVWMWVSNYGRIGV